MFIGLWRKHSSHPRLPQRANLLGWILDRCALVVGFRFPLQTPAHSKMLRPASVLPSDSAGQFSRYQGPHM
jgi:hypothetical protein